MRVLRFKFRLCSSLALPGTQPAVSAGEAMQEEQTARLDTLSGSPQWGENPSMVYSWSQLPSVFQKSIGCLLSVIRHPGLPVSIPLNALLL